MWLQNMLKNPLYTGMFASIMAMFYFLLMSINANLPPALVFSGCVGYFAYHFVARNQKNEEGFIDINKLINMY